jgi:hypothetical protein
MSSGQANVMVSKQDVCRASLEDDYDAVRESAR